MNITMLDGYSINPGDLTWGPVESICHFTCYDRTPDELIIDRIEDVDGIFVSKCEITGEIMDACKRLRYIGVTATGYDNVDIEAARARGIAVTNNPAYSTDAVAQHVFALILELTNHVADYNASVHHGDWYRSPDFSYFREPLSLLNGKSLGIIGYGNIGKRVARIAEAFGMEIHIASRDPLAAQTADIVTLHCPLTADNHWLIDRDYIAGMKDGAILINTARGGLVCGEAVAEALDTGKLAACAVDVLETEPPEIGDPLVSHPRCIVTPHIAWMPQETRQKVIDVTADNLRSFLEGGDLNRIV